MLKRAGRGIEIAPFDSASIPCCRSRMFPAIRFGNELARAGRESR
jgi:hypothetical protein